jgi:para-nitrobenzyl esterase
MNRNTKEVVLSEGNVEGTALGGVASFLGIPYAAAPVGMLRFRAPQPHPGWDTTLEAFSFASKAVQTPFDPGRALEDPGSEDCLYLNVWAPVDGGPHPVMLWVHGGAFISGSNRDIDGAALAKTGLVIVAPNYRIGPFGYLYLEDLAPGATDTNLALRDLACALDWTVRNIASFGGDPSRVALAGQSSGAMTVGALATSPLAAGKFCAAWMMSGAARQVRRKSVATHSAKMFLAATGLADATASDIVSMPTETLVKASTAMAQFSQSDDRFDAEAVLPVVGDDVLPVHPMTAIRRGDLAGVDLAVTWTLRDMGFFRKLDPESGGRNKELFARRLIGDAKWEELAETYKRTGTHWYVELLTDFHFSIPARRLAEAQIAAGGRCLVGRFDRTPTTSPWPEYGPVHTSDLFYLFTPLSEPTAGPGGIGPGTGMLEDDTTLAKHTRSLMVALADGSLGDPQSVWPGYDEKTRPTLLFDDPLCVAADPDAERRIGWDGLLEEV